MKIKQIIALTTTAALLLGAATVGANASTEFSDLKTTNWAHDAVVKMTDNGIIKGYPDGTFKPQGTVTFGEFIKMAVVEYLGEDTVGNTTEKGKNWADGYYNKAVELGLFTEEQIGKDNLNKSIPRSYMAVISANAIKKEVGNQSFSDEELNKLYSNIADIDANSANAYEIAKAYGFGLLTGYENNKFKPDGTLTRSESAMVIYRLIDSEARVYPEIIDNKDVSTDTEKKVTDTDNKTVTTKTDSDNKDKGKTDTNDIGDVTLTPLEKVYEACGIEKAMKISDVIKSYGIYNYTPTGDDENGERMDCNPMHGKFYTGLFAHYVNGVLTPNYTDAYYSFTSKYDGGDGVSEEPEEIKKMVDDDMYGVKHLTNAKIVKSTPFEFYKAKETYGDDCIVCSKNHNEMGYGVDYPDNRDTPSALIICDGKAYTTFYNIYGNGITIDSTKNIGTIKIPDFDYLGIYGTGDTLYLIPSSMIHFEYQDIVTNSLADFNESAVGKLVNK